MINMAVTLAHNAKSVLSIIFFFQIPAIKFSLQPVFQSTEDSMARTSTENGAYFSTT